MSIRTFTAVLHKEDDLYVAGCPEVGTVNQRYAIEKAIANLKEWPLNESISIAKGRQLYARAYGYKA